MIRIDAENLSERENYKLLTGTVVPRPIALVTTLSEDGVLNAAPFSYFNIVTADPPLISVSVQRKRGIRKDTSRHAVARGEFVVHIADESYVEKLNATAASLPPEESEVALAGLTAVPSERISVPGIADAKVRLECVLEQAIPLGGTADAPAADLLIGRVIRYHLHESIADERNHIDASVLQPVSRLAGASYAKLGELFEVERPS
ncbi:flavin reductase family protein [Paenibacillus sp. JDR-2]|uniref:flavin reductase family protein n=1 Tax=Paenibacillus sp. (strain JDR-2) TaxID=324057 RepID=UPI000166AD80|nr:flavin reductase family protein [Paenibacillus sp. JDR-2]ACT04576.1 flavin reductase domain protein FMN-binding [Paenibacillus sp. JDR-2]